MGRFPDFGRSGFGGRPAASMSPFGLSRLYFIDIIIGHHFDPRSDNWQRTIVCYGVYGLHPITVPSYRPLPMQLGVNIKFENTSAYARAWC